MYNPLKYIVPRKIGLALGSGGAKGMAHIAVLDYLKNMNIPVHMVAGSSIGAVVGALYCCGAMDSFIDDIVAMDKRELVSLFDPVFPRSGLVQGRKVMTFLEKYISAGTLIEDLGIPLAICAAEYNTGMTVVFRKGNLLEALRASISIPGVLVPVKYRGTLLLDGGVSNPLPVNIVKDMGAHITIAVNLHPRIGKGMLRSFVKSEMHRFRLVLDSDEIKFIEDAAPVIVPSGEEKKSWVGTVSHWLRTDTPQEQKEETPSIMDLIAKSFDIMEYVNTMLMLKYNRPTVLIEPDVSRFGTFDFLEAEAILKEGDMACERKKGTLKRRVASWV